MSDVALAGLIVVMIWIVILQHNFAAYKQTGAAFKNYYNKGIINGGSLAAFFVAIGLFSNAFENSSLYGLTFCWHRHRFSQYYP